MNGTLSFAAHFERFSFLVHFTGAYTTAPEVYGGSLPDEYVFLQFHFHWGSTDERGSEHVIYNKRFPLEVKLLTSLQFYFFVLPEKNVEKERKFFVEYSYCIQSFPAWACGK